MERSPAIKRVRMHCGTPSSASSGQVFDGRSDSVNMEEDEDEVCTQFVRGDNEQPILMSQTDNPAPQGVAVSTPRHGAIVRHGAGRAPVHPKRGKSIHDRVHGTIELDRLLVAVLDTPQFQRLDRIQQLGACNYVYRSAKHSRIEHSIGVSHLAGLLLKHLRANQPELGISDDDVLCVQLAGLVHDLGHGPFSHMFEHFVAWQGERDAQAAAAMPDGTDKNATVDRAHRLNTWSHEDMSIQLLDLLIESNDIPLEMYFSTEPGNPTPAEHLELVKQLIRGLKPSEPWPRGTGRGEEKRFLYDIVSNSRHGLDVDKLDYLLRDSMACLGSYQVFEISRLIGATRVLTATDPNGHEPHSQVCFQQKVLRDVVNIHTIRAELHQTVYQHHTANVIELMITDVLKLACDYQFRGAHDQPTTLADAALDPSGFCQLTDSIIDTFWVSLDKTLKPAQQLIARIQIRDCYKQVGQPYTISHLPLCINEHCRKPTPIQARFCPVCKTSCRKREYMGGSEEGMTDATHPGIPPQLHKTADDFKKEILETVPPEHRPEVMEHADEVAVHLVIITHGKERSKKDPFGKWWKVHDPVSGVGFFNLKEEGEYKDEVHYWERDNMPKITLPAEDQQRTLWIYLKQDVQLPSGAMLSDRLYIAYELWCQATMGGMKTQGGQNTPRHTLGGSIDRAPTRLGRLPPTRLCIGDASAGEASVPDEGDDDAEVEADADDN